MFLMLYFKVNLYICVNKKIKKILYIKKEFNPWLCQYLHEY